MVIEAREEVNNGRRELQSRVNAIKDCYNLLVQKEQEAEKIAADNENLQKQSEENIKKIMEKIESGEDPEKDIRSIGERPEKIRDIKIAKSKLEKSKNIT